MGTDRQEVHVCFGDKVFCMEEVEREDGGRPHLVAGSKYKVAVPYKRSTAPYLLPAARARGKEWGRPGRTCQKRISG